jgi:hypothetical protein
MGRMAGQDKDRAERLAAALRENLRKRKAQARGLTGQSDGDADRQHDRDQG